jgi:hypothetical protein
MYQHITVSLLIDNVTNNVNLYRENLLPSGGDSHAYALWNKATCEYLKLCYT